MRGERSGKGALVWKDGSKYVGDFAGGLQHGQGKLTSPDGSSYDGDWQKGKKVR